MKKTYTKSLFSQNKKRKG